MNGLNSEQLPIVGFEMILCLLEYCYNFLGKGNTRQVDWHWSDIIYYGW